MKKINIKISFSIYVLVVLGLGMHRARAQQDVQFTQFYANRMFYSPAAMVGTDQLFRVSLTDREQWWGSGSDRPSYRTLNVSQFFTEQNMGIGLTVYEWNQNIETNLLAKLSYSYQLQVGREAWMSFGVNVGIMNGWYNDVVLPDGQGGGAVEDYLEASPNMDLGLGIEFYTKELVAGVSVQHLPIKIGANPMTMLFHSYYYFGYNAPLSENWSLFPMIMLRTAGKSTNLDVSLRAFYRDIINFGASYRLDAVALMAGVNLGKHFTLSYSCDVPIGQIRNRFTKPSHELMLSFRGCIMCKKKDAPLMLFE